MNALNLTEINWHYFDHIPILLKYLMLFFLLLLLGFGDYWLILKPNVNYYDLLVKEEKTIKLEIAEKQKLSNLIEYKTQVLKLEKRYKNELSQLIKRKKIARLLNQISKIGVASGLVIESISPQLEENYRFLAALTTNLIITGDYPQLRLFFNRIAKLNFLINFQEMDILKVRSARWQGGSEVKMNRLRMEVKVKIYYLPNNPRKII